MNINTTSVTELTIVQYLGYSLVIIVSYTGAMLCLGTVVFALILGAKATSLTQLEQKLNDLYVL